MTLNNTQALALAILRDGPSSGGQIFEKISGRFGSFFNVTRSTAYRELSHMANEGLVRHRNHHDYVITATGQERFHNWLASASDPDMLRSTVLLRMVFAGAMSAEERGRFITEARSIYTDQLREARAAYGTLATDPYGKAIAELVAARFAAALEFIDSLPE